MSEMLAIAVEALDTPERRVIQLASLRHDDETDLVMSAFILARCMHG